MAFLLAGLDRNVPSAAEIAADELAAEQRLKRDVVAEWRVPTRERLHVVEFEHGTTSGKRVLWVDGKVCAKSSGGWVIQKLRTTNQIDLYFSKI